jgi:hypothetical protein
MSSSDTLKDEPWLRCDARVFCAACSAPARLSHKIRTHSLWTRAAEQFGLGAGMCPQTNYLFLGFLKRRLKWSARLATPPPVRPCPLLVLLFLLSFNPCCFSVLGLQFGFIATEKIFDLSFSGSQFGLNRVIGVRSSWIRPTTVKRLSADRVFTNVYGRILSPGRSRLLVESAEF